MAFKSKMNPEELSSMTYKEYFTQFKKEVKKAEKFGATSVVILSDFEFSCGQVGTILILGKYSGPLAKWYKRMKKERKQEKDFAKGTCYFKADESGAVTLNIALDDGKGKPEKMKKNGKSLFKKLGYSPNIFKGDFLEGAEGVLSETELENMDQVADEMNDDKRLGGLARKYRRAFKVVSNQVIPAIKEKTSLSLTHLEAAKAAYIAAQSFIDRYDEVPAKQQERFSDLEQQVKTNLSNLQKVVAKAKQLLIGKSTFSGNVEKVMEQLSAKQMEIDLAFDQLSDELKKALNL